MTFFDVLRNQGGNPVPVHDHDASEVSGEAVFLSLEVDNLISGTITGQQITIAGGTAGIIQSDNYVPTSSGWQILGDGSAEFNDVTIRGAVIAGAGSQIGFDLVTAGSNTASLVIGAAGTLESSNYNPGSAGWQIDGNGNAEFDNITARGSITAQAGSDVPATYLTTGTVGTETVTMQNSASSILRSANFSAGSAGWRIRGNGDAEFNDVTVRGTIFASAGEITGNLTLNGGTLTTSPSGQRIALENDDTLYFYSGSTDETLPAFINTNVTAGTPDDIDVFIATALTTAAGRTSIGLYSDSRIEMIVGVGGDELVLIASGGGGDPALAFPEPGSAAFPSIVGQATLTRDSGIYFFGDETRFSVAGVLALRVGVGSNQDIALGSGGTGKGLVYNAAGSAAFPTYGFEGDTGVGMYRIATDVLGFATASTERMRLNADGRLGFSTGSQTQPTIYWGTDTDTGIWHPGDGVIELVVNGPGAAAPGGVIVRDDATGLAFHPKVDNQFNLGLSGFRWVDVWAVDGTINTSDRKQKEDVEDSDLGLTFINALRPRKWKWIDGQRPHYGLVADEVRSAMKKMGVGDFAGYVDPRFEADDPKGYSGDPDKKRVPRTKRPKGLRYHEFTAPMIRAIQEIAGDNDSLRSEITQLRDRLDRLENRAA